MDLLSRSEFVGPFDMSVINREEDRRHQKEDLECFLSDRPRLMIHMSEVDLVRQLVIYHWISPPILAQHTSRCLLRGIEPAIPAGLVNGEMTVAARRRFPCDPLWAQTYDTGRHYVVLLFEALGTKIGLAFCLFVFVVVFVFVFLNQPNKSVNQSCHGVAAEGGGCRVQDYKAIGEAWHLLQIVDDGLRAEVGVADDGALVLVS